MKKAVEVEGKAVETIDGSLSPMKLGDLPIGDKIADYEKMLVKQVKLIEKSKNTWQEIEKVCKKSSYINNHGVSDCIQKQTLVVLKEVPGDDEYKNFCASFGQYVDYLLGAERELTEIIGEDAVKELKAVQNTRINMKRPVKDEEATKALWEEYEKVVEEYRKVQNELSSLNIERNNANEYVAYVRDIASIASLVGPKKSE